MACLNNLPVINRNLKNALTGRFFVIALAILTPQLCHAETKNKLDCVSTHYNEKSYISYVIDGDTVVLNDKRHIRLIGINTPEINHDKKPSEDGAQLARKSLIQILQTQQDVQLVYGKERHDRHGRTLAHLFLNDGTNVQARLLKDGLAIPLRIPPNIRYAECYEQASLYAKNQAKGLWALPRNKVHKVSKLNGTERGYYIISGKVRRVSENQSAIWINIDNNVALKVKKDDLQYFNKTRIHSLQGKTIEAHGWLYQHKNQLRMLLRHKLDLKVLKSKL